MDEFVRKPKQPTKGLDIGSASVPKSIEIPNSMDTLQKQVIPEPTSTPPKSAKKRMPKFKIPVPKTKKQWIIAIIAMVIALTGTAFAVYWFIFRDTKQAPVAIIAEPPVDPGPQPIYSKVSGREVEESINLRPTYAVQIENSPEARPQSGLREADIVSEAIAEGGITRFNAVYHDNIPASLGPVRSLRPYFIDWFLPYDAAIVHAGGSGEALADISALGLKDIDHSNSDGIMQRMSGRYAPHNLYTTGQKVNDLMAKRSFKSTVKTSLERKEPEPNQAPPAKNIAVNISRNLYNVAYTYDPATNTYLRSQGGVAHVDADTKQQISPNVVVVPVIAYNIHPNRVHSQYATVGSGKVYVFQDGNVSEGTWEKPSRDSQWILKNSDGEIIKLNRGQTWFSVVASADKVSYTP